MSLKNFLKNILSVVVGVITAIVIAFPIACFGALLQFSDAPIPKGQYIFSITILVLGVVLGTFTGGIVTARIAAMKKYLCIGLTGLILILSLLIAGGFSLTNWDELLMLIAIIPAVFAGGHYFIVKQRKE